MLRIPRSLYGDAGSRALDIPEVVRGQFNFNRTEVLLQARQLGRTGYGCDPGLLGEQPGQGQLGGRSVLSGGQFSQHIHQGLVRLPFLGCEPGYDVAEIVTVELRLVVDLPGEKSLAQRAERRVRA